MLKPVLDARDRVYIARQPIFDDAGRVFGYELLYRATATDVVCEEVPERAATRVLSDALLAIGLDTLTRGTRAFVNFTQEMLLTDLATLLPPSQVVIEILECEAISAGAVDACRSLHERGYQLALDDFAPGSALEPLLPFASFVKVDVLATTPEERAFLHEMLPPGMVKLAEKVESHDVFTRMRGDGYGLFQGFYFCTPTTVSAEALSSRRLAYAQLLAALSSPHVSVSTIEDLIKHDASLSYRVLRCVNSAAFGVRREVTSIRQALVLLGLDRVRKWACVWTMAGLNDGANPELVTTAVLRARCCENVATTLGGAEPSEFFLLGLCSLMDTMLGRPMDEAIADLPLPDAIRQALTGTANVQRAVLDAVLAYEQGDWHEAARVGTGSGLDPNAISEAYGDALKWARELSILTAA